MPKRPVRRTRCTAIAYLRASKDEQRLSRNRLHSTTRDPRFEILSTDRPIPAASKRWELVRTDGLTQNADGRRCQPRSVRERDQCPIAPFGPIVRHFSRETCESVRGIGERA